jgi:hypothetical protein
MVPPCGQGNFVPGTRWLASTSPAPATRAATSKAHTGQVTTISLTRTPHHAKHTAAAVIRAARTN